MRSRFAHLCIVVIEHHTKMNEWFVEVLMIFLLQVVWVDYTYYIQAISVNQCRAVSLAGTSFNFVDKFCLSFPTHADIIGC